MNAEDKEQFQQIELKFSSLKNSVDTFIQVTGLNYQHIKEGMDETRTLVENISLNQQKLEHDFNIRFEKSREEVQRVKEQHLTCAAPVKVNRLEEEVEKLNMSTLQAQVLQKFPNFQKAYMIGNAVLTISAITVLVIAIIQLSN